MSATRKFLSLVPYSFLPAHTGGQKAIMLFNKYLAQQTSLHCITVRENENRLAGYEAAALLGSGKSRYADPRNYFRIRKYIRQEKITHLIVEHPYLGWLAVMLRRTCGIKLIVRSHNIESIRWKHLGKWWWPLLYQYEKWVHRNADLNLFITDEDRQFAEQNFRLRPGRCITATYGTDVSGTPAQSVRSFASAKLRQLHQIDSGDTIILFNGAFDYGPNLKALEALLFEINPLLTKHSEFQYKLIICGKHLPERLDHQSFPNIIFAGFVDDIKLYLNGASIFLNPIDSGGGIKTKLVEALAYNANCISFDTGAIGIPEGVAGEKLRRVPDGDFTAFAAAVLDMSAQPDQTLPSSFYEHFYWPNIIRTVLQAAERLP